MYNLAPNPVQRTNRTVLSVQALAVILAVAPCLTYAQRQSSTAAKSHPGPLSPQQIARILTDSLVLIETSDKDGKPIARGSGFYIDKQTIITNLHVLEWAYSATITVVKSGSKVNLEVVHAIDRQHDLCTLTVREEGVPVKIARRKPQVGDAIYTLGNPLGLTATFSSGMVSAIRTGFIQIDAPISPGSSGGPVANDRAEVVGISTSSRTEGQNLNFAVPVLALNSSADNLTVKDAGAVAITDADYQHISGPVKLVQLWRTEYDQKGNRGLKKLLFTWEFNHRSDVTVACDYSNSDLGNCTKFEYGEDNLLKKITRVTTKEYRPPQLYKDRPSALEKMIRNRPISVEVKSADGESVQVHDSFGNVIEERADTYTRKITYDAPDNIGVGA